MEYVDAVALIKKYDIDFAEGSIVRSVDEALKAAEYPVALKIMSDEISHKSDKGCVKLNVKDEDSLRKAYSEIMSNVGSAKVDGVLVQRMAKPGLELIVGGRRDKQFGPVVLFGLGGIFVEVFKDFSLRVCPIDRNDALEMISEMKAYQLLTGARGTKPVDIEAIVDLLQKASKLLYENKQINEMDLNPVIAYEKGYCAVDVRVLP
ncbi:MAG: ATP-grasp domain protein [Candidatus Fermentimicrarchaeum limneticum]|uniref:ATP-grasp domain protein n=1 Tax=Fermentimicrarchaeum limneticum TaxID=2795018 RepID=A0A7D6BSG1_FERL1|nr:MAG: ATP-grasp domain protein [Candidatus Fermentimicrarchaeum limneticum]